MLIKIDKLVEQNYQTNQYNRQLNAEKICRFCKEAIKEVFNQETTSSLIEVISFKNGNLKLKFSSSVIACELKYYVDILIRKINEDIGESVVKNIIFVK